MNINISILKTSLIAAFLLMALSSANVFAQSVERIYAASSCNTPSYDTGFDYGDWEYNFNGDQSMDAGVLSGGGTTRVICPIVRQKVGSASGAKFYVYVDDMSSGMIECNMTSRRPHNGALVSSGSRSRTFAQANANDEVVLARSISPSSTYGHYSLECSTDDINPAIHGYRIKEF